MEENITNPMFIKIKEKFQSSADFQYRKFTSGEKVIYLCYLDTMVDSEDIQTHILKKSFRKIDEDSNDTSVLEISKVKSLDECVQLILNGNVITFYEENETSIAYSTPHKSDRSIQESSSERVITGAHDSFVESIKTNSTMLRRRLRTIDFIIKNFTVGKQNPIQLSLYYLKSQTPPEMIEKLESKIKILESKDWVDSVQVQEIIEEVPTSPFPQVLRTERPDRTYQHLLKGKPAIILDNDPNALLFPTSLYNFLQSPEDFNLRWLLGVFYYVLRIVGFWMAVSLPAFYIAITAFHSNILPLGIFYTLKLSVENVPFPPLLEAIIMQVFLELLREAALRLPQAVGSTIGTVGAIVIGTSIVQTNLISNSMIVIIAITAVASFTMPVKEMSVAARLIGLPLTILASIFGFLGISLGLLMIVSHLSKIKLLGHRYVENPGFTEFTILKNKKVNKS